MKENPYVFEDGNIVKHDFRQDVALESKVEYVKGDLFVYFESSGENMVLVHGANCFHLMGAGVAKFVKMNYPEAYEADLQTGYADKKKLGQCSLAVVDSNRWIANLYTQYQPGPNFVSDALVHSLTNLYNKLKGEYVIVMPWVGCGIGGGDKELVKHIIELFSLMYGVKIKIFEL